MQITNRKPFINDVMFGDMAEFAQHQIVTSPYRHKVTLFINEENVATVEDVRIIFNEPKVAQVKCRVAESKHITFKKENTAKLVIEALAPNKEPKTEITITEWFEETSGLVDGIDEADGVITPNKWLYFKGTK